MPRYRSLLKQIQTATVSPEQFSFQRRRPKTTYTGTLLAEMAPGGSFSCSFLRLSLVLICFFVATSISFFVLLGASYLAGYHLPESLSSPYLRGIMPSVVSNFIADSDEYKLKRVLENAAMKDGTVILTTLNEAWAAPNSISDLFLESFKIGKGTRRLLNHLVIVALDEKAYSRCLVLHFHCYALVSKDDDFSKEAFFMTPDYLNMMWKRIDFLRSVLEMGHNFVFTDADVMWFRDPFPRFYSDADFQIACDHYVGSSYDLSNFPNGGFNFVKSNNRTIEFYKFWYSAREWYPGYHDQDVLNAIKRHPYVVDLELRMRFLNTTFFGGFCEPSKDLNQVCTMHANCCVGLDYKLRDLRIMLEDWKLYLSLPLSYKRLPISLWRVPYVCRHSFGAPRASIEKKIEATAL